MPLIIAVTRRLASAVDIDALSLEEKAVDLTVNTIDAPCFLVNTQFN